MLSGKQLRRLPKVKRHRRGMNRQQLARWVQERYPSGVFTDGEIDSMRAIERAIRSDYPMDPRVRKLVVKAMAKIVRTNQSDPCKIQAARVLVAADGINVKREALDQREDHHDDELELAEASRSGLAALAAEVRARRLALDVPSRPVRDAVKSTGQPQAGSGAAQDEPR